MNELSKVETDGESAIEPDPVIAWGSDVAASLLRALDVPYIALNPGASYRGLHDSLVNHLGNENPQMLMCLHEEHAVAIAHGYAKAAGKPMAVALHANVGVMHATMAIFNAWCDRVPMLLLGATGPMDAAKRRPWIDWLHTAQDQAALIRPFIKWDDQPASVVAIPESLLRGWQIAQTSPCGPVYVCFDAELQEQELREPVKLPDVTRYAPPAPTAPNAAAISAAANMLRSAKAPLLLFGRGARTREVMDLRLALAEHVNGRMLSDLKSGTMVPSDHHLHVGVPFNKLTPEAKDALKQADLIVSFGSVDLGGIIRMAFGGEEPAVKIIHAGDDVHLHNGWGKEHCALPPVDIGMLCNADAAVSALVAELEAKVVTTKPDLSRAPVTAAPELKDGKLTMEHVAHALASKTDGQPVTFATLPRGWPGAAFPNREPLEYLGKDGGGGIGSGPGLAIGAALAHRGTDRLSISVIGDGDCLMGINALWTAAKYNIPALIVVANNNAYLNDVLHQDSVAVQRDRNRENRWVGQAIDGPVPDIAAMARAQGVEAAGPVHTADELDTALSLGVETIKSGQPFLVDVRISLEDGRLQSQRGK